MKKSKPAPKKSAAAKPAAKKTAAKKPAPKPAAKTAAKKPAPKPAAKKSAAAAPKHASAKAKPATKKAPAPVAKKPAAKPAAKKPADKPVVKSAPAAAKTPAATAAAKPAATTAAKTAAAPAAGPKHASAPAEKPAKAAGKSKDAKAAPAAPVEVFPALDPNMKRPAKPFFMEVKPGVERVIKRGDKSAVSQVIDLQARRKGPTAEETSDELAERIERELQSQSFLKRASMRPQMCTKCGINAVTPRFTIDRELGYCEICAEILHLGETKEARRMEISLAAKKDEDSEEGEEAEGPSPDEVEDIPEDVD